MSGKKELIVDDLTPALVFADYQYKIRHVLRPNPGENPLAKCVNKILNILREAYPGGWGSGLRAQRLVAVVEVLGGCNQVSRSRWTD